MTRHRGRTMAPLLSLLLVLAFLAHDAWMVDAHAGRIVSAAADDASAMGERAHAGHHGTSPLDTVPASNGLLAPSSWLPPMMTCETLRTGTLGQQTGTPEPSVSLAVLPVLNDTPDHLGVWGRVDWRPPGQPPEVRRAFLQVYRE